MEPCAGPRPVASLSSKSGSNGVKIHVMQRGQQMRRLQRAGEKAVLPQVSTPVLAAVQFERILRVGLPDGEGERILALGNGDQVNVIRHQAPSENTDAVTLRLEMQELQIEGTVVIGKEDVLPVIAALGNVVGCSGKNESGSAGHAYEWGEVRPVLRENAVAVGTSIAARPPHRSVRAALPHTAPTLDE